MGVDFEPGAEFAGHRIVAPLGRGGMGVVYHAVHLGLERDVALKVIAADRAVDPGFRERFRREARSAAALDHPGVITIYEAGVVEDLPYMTMRLVRGPDLGRQLRIGGPLAPEVAAGVVAMVADALETAHEAGLVHRDIKPANILLERRGRELRALLADFGLARLAEGSSALTTTGSWLGTVDYAAPETLAGEPATPAADVYALGAVLHAALTGRPPFARETAAAVIWAHAHDPPPRLAEVEHPSATALEAVIARALAKTPGERFAGAGELADAVRAATGPPSELPLLAQPLALIGELASEITTDPLGSGLTSTERAPAGAETRRAKPAGWAGAPPPGATGRDEAAAPPHTPATPPPDAAGTIGPAGAGEAGGPPPHPSAAPPPDAAGASGPGGASEAAPPDTAGRDERAAAPPHARATPPPEAAGGDEGASGPGDADAGPGRPGEGAGATPPGTAGRDDAAAAAPPETPDAAGTSGPGGAGKAAPPVPARPGDGAGTPAAGAPSPTLRDPRAAGEGLPAGDVPSPDPARTGETPPADVPSPPPAGRATRRLPAAQITGRRGLLAALGIVVVIGAVALFVVLSRDEVGALEATRLTVDAIPVAAAPVGLSAADDGTPWVLTTASDVGFVRPIEDDKAGDELMLDDPAYSFASTGSDLWATTEGGVVRIDPVARQVLGGPVDLEAGSDSEIAAGEGALWVSDTIDNSVIRADAKTARAVDDPIAVGATMRDAIVAGEGAVWVLRADIDADTTEVVQVDPAKKEAGQSIRTGTFSDTEALAVGEGGVWTAGGEDDETRLVRVDPAAVKLDSRSPTFEDGISAIAAGEGAVWVLDGQGGTVTRVDPATIKPVGQPIAVAAGGDSRLSVTEDAVWVLSPRRGAIRITWGD